MNQILGNLTKQFESFGYFVEAEGTKDNLVVNFKVYEDPDVFSVHLAGQPKPEYKPFFSGHVKWDGCSNWTCDQSLHFCCPQQAIDFGLLLAELYKVAAEIIPEHADSIMDQRWI